MGFDFENLDVYKKAVKFAQSIYETSRKFPDSEMYGLRGQLRRAAVSISANIAEGAGRYRKETFHNF